MDQTRTTAIALASVLAGAGSIVDTLTGYRKVPALRSWRETQTLDEAAHYRAKAQAKRDMRAAKRTRTEECHAV